MALEINGYKAQFDRFVNFAKAQEVADKQKAIATVDTSKAEGLAGRTIKAGTGDWVGIGQGRLWTKKAVNDDTVANASSEKITPENRS